MTISNHFMAERADRYTFIATNIGLGTVVHTHRQEWSKYGSTPTTVKITSTGIAMVMTDDDKLVTMYVLTLKEAERYYNNAIPMVIEAIIKKNMRKKYHLLQNEIKY